MDQAQIQSMIKAYIQHLLDEDMDYRINRDPIEAVEDPYTGEIVSHMPELTILNDLKGNAVDQLMRSDYSEVRVMVDQMLERGGVGDLPERTINQLCHNLLKALPDYYGVLEERAMGNFEHQDQVQNEPLPQSPQPASSEPQVTIKKVAENYWEDRSPTWKPRSAKDYKRSKERLIEFLGKDTPVSSINYDTMKNYRRSLVDSGLSISSINFHVGFAAAVFNHEMKTTGTMRINPCSGLKLKDKRRKDKLRDEFTIEDLSKLFAPEAYLKYAKNPAFFWVPLISLFCGCRLEEPAQLYTDQIRKVGGVWCIVFDEEHPEQSLKSSEKRDVPIHPFLMKLGLHRYAQEQTHERLWPELKRQNDRYAHYLGRRFGDYRKKQGLTGKVTFHSFRHTVETELREKDVDGLWINILTGHSISGEGESRYTKRKPKTILEKAVLKLEWDKKLDLSALMNCEFARPE